MSNEEKPIIIDATETATSSIIWLHGLGANGHDFVPLAPALKLNNTRFIFPHAPIRKITINMGMEMRGWYDIFGFDRHAQQDEAGIKHSQTLINQLIENEIEQGISSKRIILAGFSQGCAMALYTGLRFPQQLAGIIGLSGYLPLAESLLSELNQQQQNADIFMAHGKLDPIVPIQFAEHSHQLLQQLRLNVDYKTYPIEHSVCDDEVNDIKNWLHKKL